MAFMLKAGLCLSLWVLRGGSTGTVKWSNLAQGFAVLRGPQLRFARIAMGAETTKASGIDP